MSFANSYFIDNQLSKLNFYDLAFQRFSVSRKGIWGVYSFLYIYNLLIIN